MLTIQETKNGGISLRFGKDHKEIALKIHAAVTQYIFGEEQQAHIDVGRLMEIKHRVEGKQNIPLIEKPKTMSKQEQYDEIYAITQAIETIYGVPRKTLWTKIYEELKERTDMTATKLKGVKSSSKYTGSRSTSKYSTLVSDGYGFVLIQIAKEIRESYKREQ